MNETLVAALIGALVGGGFAILGGIVVHFLNLREDRIKRERDKADKRVEETRKNLSSDEGTSKAKIVRAYGGKWSWTSDGKLRREKDVYEYTDEYQGRDYGERGWDPGERGWDPGERGWDYGERGWDYGERGQRVYGEEGYGKEQPLDQEDSEA